MLLEQFAEFTRWRGGRNFLNVSHLNRAAFPGGQNLLDALAQNAISLGDPGAAPSKKKIKLHGLTLQIGAVVFREGRHLRRETDPVLANLRSQFGQREFLDLVAALNPRPNPIHGQRAIR